MVRTRRWTVRAQCFAMLASVGLLVACQERVLTYDGAQGGTIHEQVLTANGADTYTYTYTFASTAGDIDVVALGTNTGGNLRAVMWPSDGPEDSDAESCATWSAASGDIVQMGAVLRARAMPDGSVRAVTVTQNIWLGGTWIFNVHVWDTALSPGGRIVKSVDLGPT